jgi:tetratricopeptide (TPR) repeat protein
MKTINIFDIHISDLTEKIGQYPNNAENYYRRGKAYDAKGNQNEAIIDYSKAIKLKSDFLDAYLSRSLCYKKMCLKNEAINDFNEVIRLDPVYAGSAVLYGFTTKTIVVDVSI